MTNPASTVAETPFPSAKTMGCPFGYYRELREGAPVFQVAGGEFVVSRHEDLMAVARAPEVFSNRHSVFDGGRQRTPTLAELDDPDRVWGLTASDDPEHAAKRKIAFEMFKPGALRGHDPMIRTHVDALIDGFAERGECEFVSEFTAPLPAMVILSMFGLPLEHVDRALSWSRYQGFGTRWASEDVRQGAAEAIIDLHDFLSEHVRARHAEPGDDELSRLVARHVAYRGRLVEADLIADATGLFIGGMLTTTHLLSTMMMLLVEHPDQQDKLRADPSLLRRAIEEALRQDSPVQISPRFVLRDTELGGLQIPAGSMVLLLWGSGNRDERMFAEPEAFDVERANVKDHLAFGHGVHFCMGAPLARLEAAIAFERLLVRLPDLRAAPGRNDYANDPTVIFRGPERVFLQFTPGA